jgi:hypothetical protein
MCEMLKINDICVGHCDNCGYLWCLECGNEIPSGKKGCEHWVICDKCPDAKPVKDCIGETIIGMTTCPYDFRIGECPRIKKEIKMNEKPSRFCNTGHGRKL